MLRFTFGFDVVSAACCVFDTYHKYNLYACLFVCLIVCLLVFVCLFVCMRAGANGGRACVQEGSVIEEGTHDELMARAGHYYGLVMAQSASGTYKPTH